MPTIDAIYSAAGAMNSLSTGMSAVAHNVANINTAGFDPQRVDYQTGPEGQGVQAAVMPPPVLERSSASVQAAQTAAESPLPPEAMDPSGTELPREFATMISTQRAYEANAVSVRAWDEMQGVLVDMKV